MQLQQLEQAIRTDILRDGDAPADLAPLAALLVAMSSDVAARLDGFEQTDVQHRDTLEFGLSYVLGTVLEIAIETGMPLKRLTARCARERVEHRARIDRLRAESRTALPSFYAQDRPALDAPNGVASGHAPGYVATADG